jgi:hypothetical protein
MTSHLMLNMKGHTVVNRTSHLAEGQLASKTIISTAQAAAAHSTGRGAGSTSQQRLSTTRALERQPANSHNTQAHTTHITTHKHTKTSA